VFLQYANTLTASTTAKAAKSDLAVWKAIVSCNGSGGIVGTSQKALNNNNNTNTSSGDEYGVLSGCGFGVVAAVEVRAEATEEFDALTVKLVQCKNMWSNSNSNNSWRWSGRWCRGHSMWADYPTIAQSLGVNTAAAAAAAAEGDVDDVVGVVGSDVL